MTKTSNAEAYRLQETLLLKTGAWPIDKPDLVYKMRTAVSWFLSLGMLITMLMEAISDLDDINKLSEILYIMSNVTAYVVKLITFTYQRNVFAEGVVQHLNKPVFASYPDELDHYLKNTIKRTSGLSNIYLFITFCQMILFAGFPVVENKPLPFPFPYELGKFRYPFYAFQIAAMCMCAWNDMVIDTLMASVMGIAAAQLDILADKIVGIIEKNAPTSNMEGSNDEEVIRRLKQCVVHHLAIVKLTESIETVFTVGFLAQFIAAALNMCLTAYYVIMISTLSSELFMLMNYFLIVLAELSMYCWFGNEVVLKSGRVGEACYNSNWYNCSNEVRKYLFIIMERAKRPLTISVFKVSKLTLTAFLSILQWSYSCLALLLKMNSKKSS